MDIVYCLDKKYENMAHKSAKTVLKHNSDANIHFLYFDNNKFPQLKEFDETLCGFKHVSRACFLRLLIPQCFPNLEKALYLDCDIVCLDSLEPLFQTDFEGNYLLATRGHLYSDVQAKQLGLPWYVISGMLMFNIPLMNKDKYFEQIKNNWRGALGKQDPFSADETIINWCFHNKIKLVSEKYNYCYNRNYGNRACSNPVILHFPGANKGDMEKYA